MNLQAAIERNRQRQARFSKYEKLLRRVRLRIFDYMDMGKEEQATRIIDKCQVIIAPKYQYRRSITVSETA
jgi:hypothetical protein